MFKKLQQLEIEDLIEFRDHGKMSNVPEEMAEYVQLLDKVRGMHLRADQYGSRDAVINHLMKFDGYSHYLAAKLHDDAMEYFYADRSISKSAWRNIIAEQMQKGINTMFALAKDAKEIGNAVKELANMAKVLGLDQPDTEEFPKELLEKPIKLYTSSAEELGMPPINRYELGRIIDGLEDITEAQKLAAKRDGQLIPLNIFNEPIPDDKHEQ